MNKFGPTCLAVTALLGIAACGWLGLAADEAPPTGLEGARPVVDAARYASLQAAFDAIPAEGGVVQLPAGTFEITEPLVLTKGEVLVRGHGPATHIVNRNEEGKPAFVIRVPGATKDSKLRPWRVHLADFRLTGNQKSGEGIVADRVNELYLEGLSITHHGGDGIALDHCYEDPRVQSCLITYNGRTGLNMWGCHDIVVNGCQFEENSDGLQCIDGFNLCATGNCFDDHLGNGIIVENTYGSVVSGNMIEECKGAAVILGRDCYGITLSSNVIAHNGLGIDLRDAHGCAVSANTFTINHAHALRIGPDSARITVTGNNFSNSFIGEGMVKRDPDDLDAAGLTLDGTRHVVISGNLFSSLKPKAVAKEGASERVLFSGNVVVDSESDHQQLDKSIVGHNKVD